MTGFPFDNIQKGLGRLWPKGVRPRDTYFLCSLFCYFVLLLGEKRRVDFKSVVDARVIEILEAAKYVTKPSAPAALPESRLSVLGNSV